MSAATQSADIAAPPEACFDAIADFGSYTSWMRAYQDVRVLEAGSEGAVVEFRVDAKLKTVRYVLRHHFDRPRRITWDYVEGDAKDVDGEWRFEPLGDGTRCTYSVEVKVGGFVPGAVKRQLAEQAVRSTLGALKRRVEG